MTRIGYFFFAFIACALVLKAYVLPRPTFDTFAYEFAVAELHDPATAGSVALHAFRKMSDGPLTTQDPQVMALMERYYASKALYVAALDGLVRAGVPLYRAPFVIGSVSIAAIAAIVLAWVERPWFASLLLLNPLTMELIRFGTPDAMATALVLAGLFALTKRRDTIAIVLLFLALWTRGNFVFLIGPVLLWMLWDRRLSGRYWAALMVLMLASTAILKTFSGDPGWRVWIYAFTHPMLSNVTFQAASGRDYLHALANAAYNIPSTPMALVAVAMTLTWRLDASVRWLVGAVAIAVAAQLVIFPWIEERLFYWACMTIAIVFLNAVMKAHSSHFSGHTTVFAAATGQRMAEVQVSRT